MKLKILIVDDEPHMLRLTELSFTKGGYETLTARNGEDAILTAQRESPALIVMDVLMPGMDGIEALQLLRGDPVTARIPVIMLTARGQQLTREAADKSGASLYMTKPFSPSVLVAEAARLIEGSRL